MISDVVLKRTHNCGQLRAGDLGGEVRLCGWVRSYRDHGGVIFVDLRDRFGITQVVFDTPEEGDEAGKAMYALADSLRNEWVISIAGVVRHRGEDRINPKLDTGQIEVLSTELTVLNESDTVPFEPDSFTAVAEETRLRYRYIDLRRPEMTYAELPVSRHDLPPEVVRQVEIETKYAGYIEREHRRIEHTASLERQRVPPDFDYWAVSSLRHEAKEKLSRVRPQTLAQASRVPGITPADIAVLIVILVRAREG